MKSFNDTSVSLVIPAKIVVTKFIRRLLCKLELSRCAVGAGPSRAETPNIEDLTGPAVRVIRLHVGSLLPRRHPDDLRAFRPNPSGPEACVPWACISTAVCPP